MTRRPLVLAVLATTSVAGSPGGSVPAASAGPDRPNVLVIVTDDQRATDTLEWMPRTMEWFGAGGTRFTNAYATTPICCPSRATIFSGRFVHNHGVRKNDQALNLDQGTTMQRHLHDAGYRTALLGKFLNFFPIHRAPSSFDHYFVLEPSGDTYHDNTFNDNGVVAPVPGYTTDLIRDRAVSLIQTDVGGADDEPWLMYVAPFAPHHPWEAAERHEGAGVGTWNGNPAVFESNVRDKPAYVRRSRRTLAEAQADRAGQLRSLLAVDELVDAVFQALEDAGEENTLALFLSDNGYFWAEHGLTSKNQAYTQSVQIPFLARWPGRIPAGRTDGRPVGNLDVAPTVMDAAGLPPAATMDGRSILDPGARTKMLAEAWTSGSRGPYASIISPRYQYVEYYKNNGRTVKYREYYDMARDPWQLRNLLGDRPGRNDPFVGALHRELAAARACAGQSGRRGCSTALGRPTVPQRCPGKAGTKGRHLVGAKRRDVIGGRDGRDVACGLNGSDRLKGKRGPDMLIGGLGRDVLVGGPGNDLLIGGGGRDLCIGNRGRDRFRACEVRR